MPPRRRAGQSDIEPPTLQRSVAATAAACPWIGPEDAALLHLGGLLAGIIDTSEDPYLTDKLSGRLVQVLSALGVTPEQRAKLNAEAPAQGKLSQLRAATGRP